VGRPARQAPLEHAIADSVEQGQGSGVVITGAGGQLGQALLEAFPRARGLTHADWDVTQPPPERLTADLVLHAAAWTDVDGAEADPQGAAAVNVGGTSHAASLAPLVYYSSDYVFDGRKQSPYVESDAPNPQSAYGRSKAFGEAAAGEQAWIVRSSWLFGATGHNFVRTMVKLGAERDEVTVVDDQVGCPTFVGHLAQATRAILELPHGIWHVAGDGECSWAEFAQAIFEEVQLECEVRPISTTELGRPAPRPAYSVLRSEKAETPRLPHWREGLRECLARLR
jgi:dTDP-4-dehydrorhamnose reductase